MPFFYIYHSLRRRTRFEEQQDFIFAWRSWCCCAVSMKARSNRMGTRTHARGTPGTGLYSKIVMVCAQCALRGSCLWTCSLCSWSVAACLRCHVAGVCVAMLVVTRGAAQSTSPQPPSPSRSPRRAELPLCVQNACVLVEVRVVLVGLHGG